MRFRIVLIGLQNIRIFGVMLRRKLAAAANLNTILKRRLHRCKRRVMIVLRFADATSIRLKNKPKIRKI